MPKFLSLISDVLICYLENVKLCMDRFQALFSMEARSTLPLLYHGIAWSSSMCIFGVILAFGKDSQ